jgi:hypothetical protein
MKWEQETWRKLYVRVDAKWLSLPVSARGLGSELLKYADDNGELHLGSDPPGVAVAFLLSARPKEHRRIAEDLDLLMSPEHRFMVQIGPGAYRIRNFVDAQAKSGSAKRMALKRARDAAPPPVTVTPNVTSRGDGSVQNKSVTGDANKVTDPIRSDPIRSDPPNPPGGSGASAEPGIPVGAVEAVWLRGLRLAGCSGIEHPRAQAIQEMAEHWQAADECGDTWAGFSARFGELIAEWVADIRRNGKQDYNRRWPWPAFAAWHDKSVHSAPAQHDDPWGDPDEAEIAAGGHIQ